MAETLYANLKRAAEAYPERIALLHKVKGEYVGILYRELIGEIDSVAASLQSLGLRKGDSIGLFAGNRPEWAIADFAAMKLGCVVVPIHPASPAAFVSYAAIDARIKVLFVENELLLKSVPVLPHHLSPIKLIVLLDGTVPRGVSSVLAFPELRTTRPTRDDVHENIASTDLATIVYTSGTTGEPKGVMLSHGNIVSNALAVRDRFNVCCDDLTLSYLPLSHMFERTCGYYTFLFAGAAIAYAESPATVANDVKAVRPTIVLAVPSVIEKAYRRVLGEVRGGSRFRRILVTVAVKVLNAYANRRYQGRRLPVWLRTAYSLSNRYVAFQFRQLAGGRLRVIASGGAPLDRKIAKMYHILGFNIVEGYGLTETSPLVACHTLSEQTLGTVGKPLIGAEVKIGMHDEILVRGSNVMQGYLNRPEDTAAVIDADGWFHTGDQGRFDPHGNLVITGRIKDIIVLSNGEKLPSAAIEAMLVRSPYISQVALFGERKKSVTALIVPDQPQVERFARSKKTIRTNYAELLQTRVVRDLITREIERSTPDLRPHERIRAFALLPDPFSVENGLLTHSLKLRRGVIEERHRNLIESLYRPADPVSRSTILDPTHAA